MQIFATKLGLAAIAASLAFAPVAAFAHAASVRVKQKAEQPLVNLVKHNVAWKTNGGVSIDEDGVITLTENGSESENAYKDIHVREREGDHVIIAAYTKAEKVRTNDITGLPYLYAYAMNKDGKILAYFQGQQMRRENAVAGRWEVNHGMFLLPEGTTTIRLFLEQSEKAGATKSGDDAQFMKPMVVIVKDKSRLQDVLGKFRFGLSLIK